jgi:hypothetical protein
MREKSRIDSGWIQDTGGVSDKEPYRFDGRTNQGTLNVASRISQRPEIQLMIQSFIVSIYLL